MRPLLLADFAQELVGGGIARRALVEVVDLLVLGRLARGQQAVDRRQLGLEAQPQRQAHAGRVGHGDAELAHALFEALAMPGFGLGHPAQDVGLALVHALGDELVNRAGHDLALPRLQQAIADFGGCLAHGRPRLPIVSER